MLDEFGLTLIEQDTGNTGEGGICHIHAYTHQAGAARERPVPNAGDAVGYRDTGQAGAGRKRIFPDGSNAAGNRVRSGFGPWVFDEFSLTLVEQDTGNTGEGGVCHIHAYTHQAGAVMERQSSNAGDAVGYRDTGQAGARIKCHFPNTGDAVADRDAGQVVAGSERHTSDAGNAIGDGNACQVVALIERLVPDAGDAVADRDAGQAAGTERPTLDAGNAIWDGDAGQKAAVIERQSPNAGDAVGYRDTGQAVAELEGTVSNGDNCKISERVGDGYCTAGTDALGDRASTVTIVRPNVIFGESHGWKK